MSGDAPWVRSTESISTTSQISRCRSSWQKAAFRAMLLDQIFDAVPRTPPDAPLVVRPACIAELMTCATSHHSGGFALSHGHELRLMPPPIHTSQSRTRSRGREQGPPQDRLGQREPEPPHPRKLIVHSAPHGEPGASDQPRQSAQSH